MPGLIEIYQKFKALVERVESLEKAKPGESSSLEGRVKTLENQYRMMNARLAKKKNNDDGRPNQGDG